ncbi:MAG: PEP-CTERM sorting domain-containing protein [bacterium]|nr:PEP-CTERM sorting domain-containing protein [bacterium]
MGVAIALIVVSVTATTASAGTFDISVNFVGGLSTSQQAIFTNAEAMWESVLTGYQSGVTYTGSLSINAQGVAIDGVGGTLGSAGPDTGVGSGGFLIVTTGSMEFDSADLDDMETNGTLYSVICHEMAHVIGFGTLWNTPALGFSGYQDVYEDGTGEYTGAAALAAYKDEFNQPTATYVPVELSGGSGTANGHWNENYGGGGLTGITDGDGNDMRNELMTGWLNAPAFLSQTTISSFEDIGYTVTPEPATMSLLMVGGLALVRRRRRR